MSKWSGPCWRVVVPGEPVAWQRVSWWRGRAHEQPAVRASKEAIGWSYKAAGGILLEGPIGLRCSFFLSRFSRFAELDPRDLDNLVKTVTDALQNVAYPNDRRVVHLEADKHIDADRPRLEFEVGIVQQLGQPWRPAWLCPG